MLPIQGVNADMLSLTVAIALTAAIAYYVPAPAADDGGCSAAFACWCLVQASLLFMTLLLRIMVVDQGIIGVASVLIIGLDNAIHVVAVTVVITVIGIIIAWTFMIISDNG